MKKVLTGLLLVIIPIVLLGYGNPTIHGVAGMMYNLEIVGIALAVGIALLLITKGVIILLSMWQDFTNKYL